MHRVVSVFAAEFADVAATVHPGLPPFLQRRVIKVEVLTRVAALIGVVLVDHATADEPLNAALGDLPAARGHIPFADPEIEFSILRLLGLASLGGIVRDPVLKF